MKTSITILHPALEAGSVPPQAPLASASNTPRSTAGGTLRVALLDNTKVNAIELFDAVARRLEQRMPIEVRRWRKRHAGESGAVAIAEMMKWKPQLVLTGLGD